MDVYSFTCPQMHGKVNRSCTSVRVLRSSLISVTITCGIVCLAFPNCWKTVRLRVNDSASEALSDGFSIFSAEPTSITRRSKVSFVSNACVVVEQARYLKNVGGAHIGHWVAVLTQLMPHFEAVARRSDNTKGGSTKLHLFFTDRQRNAWQLQTIGSFLRNHPYYQITAKAAMHGFNTHVILRTTVLDTLSRGNSKCMQSIDAGNFPTDEMWTPGLRRFVHGAFKAAGCSRNDNVADVLIYNRKGTREITNVRDVADYLQDRNYSVLIQTAEFLTPAQQVCLIGKPFRYIVTPHGGQMASLMFINERTRVVEVMPRSGVLECYRYISTQESAAAWFALQGARLWRCVGLCVDDARKNTSAGAILIPEDGGIKLARETRAESISVNVTGIQALLDADN